MSKDRRAATVALTVLLLLWTVAAATAAPTFFATKGPLVLQTDSGLTVIQQEDLDRESGNPFTANSVEIRNVTFKSGDGSVTVSEINDGTWTNTTSLTTGSSPLQIDRPDASAINVTGTLDGIDIRSINYSRADSTTEIVSSAGGSWGMTVKQTGLSKGQGVVLVNQDTGEVLDAASVDADGSVQFTDLPSVTSANLGIRKGASVLKVFQETDPTKLVDDATLRIRFVTDSGGNAKVVERQVQNGKVDLTGIPNDRRIVVTVKEESSGDYVYRRIVIKNVEQQQEIYLLNRSKADVQIADVVFALDDRTGNFPASSTLLQIQKPVTKDFDGDGTNETRYQTIAGDVFGAAGQFPVTLAAENRYRLKVTNAKGDTRVLGSYTARVDDTPTVRIGQVTFDIKGDKGYAADLSTFTSDVDGDGYEEFFARVIYRDAARRTEEFSFTLEYRNGTIIKNQTTVDGPLGNYTATFQLAENKTEQTYVLDWEAIREQDDGTDKTITGRSFAGKVSEIVQQIPIDPRWLSLIGYVALVAVTGLVVVIDSAVAAAVAVVLGSAFTFLGIISIPVPALGLGAAVSITALVGRSSQ